MLFTKVTTIFKEAGENVVFLIKHDEMLSDRGHKLTNTVYLLCIMWNNFTQENHDDKITCN